MENFAFPLMAVFGCFVGVYIYRYLSYAPILERTICSSWRFQENSRSSTRCVPDLEWLAMKEEKKTAADSKTVLRKLGTHLTGVVISIRERLLEFYSDKKYSIHQRGLALEVIQVICFAGAGKVGTIPCNAALSLSLGQRVGDWLHGI